MMYFVQVFFMLSSRLAGSFEFESRPFYIRLPVAHVANNASDYGQVMLNQGSFNMKSL